MKHSLHGEITVSIYLKLFISTNEICHTNDASVCISGTLISNVNNIQSIIPKEQTKYNYTRMKYVATF